MTRPPVTATSATPAHPTTSRPGSVVAEVRAAIAFLTRVPVRRATEDLDRTGAAAFGLVGAGIGLVAAIPIVVLGPLLAAPSAVMALAVVAIGSGGLHLDGLADTADALAAPTPDAAERARTDPRAGPAGVMAIVLDLMLAAGLLAAIVAADPRLGAAALVVAATGSRAAAPIAAWVDRSRRTRRPDGLGGWFAGRVGTGDVVPAALTTVCMTAVAALVSGGASVVLGATAGLALALVAAGLVIARRGQLDGDGYGAIVEITFVAILAGIAIVPPLLPS
jgi:adenosylcobinamide-GDP ribazoletransferase